MRPDPTYSLAARDWYFITEQPAPAPHLAHPEGCAAIRIVLVTVPRPSSPERHPSSCIHDCCASVFRIGTPLALNTSSDASCAVIHVCRCIYTPAWGLSERGRRSAPSPWMHQSSSPHVRTRSVIDNAVCSGVGMDLGLLPRLGSGAAIRRRGDSEAAGKEWGMTAQAPYGVFSAVRAGCSMCPAVAPCGCRWRAGKRGLWTRRSCSARRATPCGEYGPGHVIPSPRKDFLCVRTGS